MHVNDTGLLLQRTVISFLKIYLLTSSQMVLKIGGLRLEIRMSVRIGAISLLKSFKRSDRLFHQVLIATLYVNMQILQLANNFKTPLIISMDSAAMSA